MPLRIFKLRNISGANAIQVLSVAGMFGDVLHGRRSTWSACCTTTRCEIGLAFLPGTLLMGGLSLGYTDKLIMRFGARNVLVPGLVLVCAALAWFTQISADGTYVVDLLPAMVLFGIGGGTAFPALMTLAMAGVEPQDAGLASGLVNTTAQVGGAIGLAVLATLSATRTDTLLADGKSQAEALTGGYQLAFVVGLGLALAALLVAAFVIKPVDPAAGATAPRPSPPRPSATPSPCPPRAPRRT